MLTTMNRTTLLIAATAIGAACFLPVAAPAQAEDCNGFYAFPAAPAGSAPFNGFTFNVELVETDPEFWKGIHVYLQTTDNEVQQAMYMNPDAPSLTGESPFTGGDPNWLAVPTRGAAAGGLKGRAIDFKVRWENKLTTVYKGQVNDDGSASGTMSSSNGTAGTWHSTFNDFKCAPGRTLGRVPVGEQHPERETMDPVVLPDQHPELEVIGPLPEVLPNNLATVVADVDVYNAKNEPDGTGQIVGILRVGNTVTLAGGCAPDSWCEVSGDSVPSGHGWVWGHLQLP